MSVTSIYSLTMAMAPSKYHLNKAEIEQEMQLVWAAQQDVQAFAPLYERYYEAILQFVFNRCESKATAIDMTAQVFFNALSNLKKFKAQGVPFSSWLYRIALNEVNKFHRRNNSQRAVSIDHVELVFEELDRNEEAEKDRKLALALQQLEEEELQYIELRFFEQRPFAEIAQICSITETNAKQKVYRTVEKLKQIIKNV